MRARRGQIGRAAGAVPSPRRRGPEPATEQRAVSRTAVVAPVLIGAAVIGSASEAVAHGVGGRTDLPVPVWNLVWAASFAVAVSFVALGLFWNEPKLGPAAEGAALPSAAQRIGRALLPPARILGLAGLAVVGYAGLWGNQNPSVNIAPIAFFVIFWVGIQILSTVLGDVWGGFNPFWALADAGAWLRTKAASAPLPPTGAGTGSRWWAVAAILSFAWLELAYHDGDSPRSIGVYLAVYASAMVLGGAVFGRRWGRDADGFGVLFTMIGAMAPLGRDGSGIWRRRPPLAGLSAIEARPGTVAFVLAVLGSTSFDGFTRSSLWLDVASNRSGWELTAVNTLGLAFAIGIVAAVYRGAIAVMAGLTGRPEADLARAFAPSLIPVVVAYSVAHYFSFLVLEGQAVYALASDPFGMGWDLFGTVEYQVNYTWISTSAIAWTQTAAIAAGHAMGVAVAHDRALELFESNRLAVRSQYPMLAAMLFYTVTGLFLLLGT